MTILKLFLGHKGLKFPKIPLLPILPVAKKPFSPVRDFDPVRDLEDSSGHRGLEVPGKVKKSTPPVRGLEEDLVLDVPNPPKSFLPVRDFDEDLVPTPPEPPILDVPNHPKSLQPVRDNSGHRDLKKTKSPVFPHRK